MRILEYIGLDTSRVAKTYRKVIEAIAADDFRAAQVKKLSNLSHGKFYRARLDEANRALFQRVAQGWYQFNPKLSVRRRENGEETWTPIFKALNLPFLNEFAKEMLESRIDVYLEQAGLPERTTPIAAERALVKAREEKQRLEQENKALQERIAAQKARAPAWGTPAARRAEIERLRREIEDKRKK